MTVIPYPQLLLTSHPDMELVANISPLILLDNACTWQRPKLV